MNLLTLPPNVVNQLLQQPDKVISCQIGPYPAKVHVALPDYEQKLQAFYGKQIFPDLASVCNRSRISCHTKHFGLVIRFEQPAILHMHDSHMRLLGDSKELIAQFEVVKLHNVQVDEQSKDVGHRNRFPHLNFHRDRNKHQPTPYSLYTRDPLDPEQRMPRISSTLFATNLVGYLQCMRERNYEHIKEGGMQPHYNIFHHEDMSQVVDNIVVEHRWDEPEGTGEISMLDNRTTLHASYLRIKDKHGYRIGVRYLC